MREPLTQEVLHKHHKNLLKKSRRCLHKTGYVKIDQEDTRRTATVYCKTYFNLLILYHSKRHNIQAAKIKLIRQMNRENQEPCN